MTRPARSGRRRLGAVLIVLLVLSLVPSYVRAYRVTGMSDAPSYLHGDLVLVNKAAYDIRLPYLDVVLLSHADPVRGEVVQYVPPDRDYPVFKRVIGTPGDVISMEGYRLTINGEPLEYEPAGWAREARVMEENRIGTRVERERGPGDPHLITYTPGVADQGSFGPVRVPEGHYFVVGDNRGHSRDSRMYGAIPRRSIIGRVSHPLMGPG